MKRSLFWGLSGFLCLGVGFFISNPQNNILNKNPPQEIHFALLQTSDDYDARQSNEAFKSVLKEEGIPVRWYSEAELIKLVPHKAPQTLKSIHLPDGAAKRISSGTVAWLKKYTHAGGHLVVVYDAAIQSPKGHYYEHSPLRDLLGIHHGSYHQYKKNMFTNSVIQFTNPQASNYWAITPGKLDHKLQVQGYSYGALHYPSIKAKILSPTVKLYATDPQSKLPILSENSVEKGKAYWVNLPLGRLKASGDDLLLRLVLRRVARNSHMPKLIPTPQGKGALIVNWHVDANSDWRSLPILLENGFLDSKIKYSFHITAGPDRDQPGDQMGFDACGKGHQLTERLKALGTLGNHGGWAHNYFTDILEHSPKISTQVKKMVDLNTNCIASILKQNVTEYSAPTGVHPQPQFTQLLEKRGFLGYYYTGDSGSSPNFTFYKGKKVSHQVVATPLTSYQKYASIAEISRAKIPPHKVERWLLNLAQYIDQEQTIRLIYSHPYDLTQHAAYQPAWRELFKYIDQGIKEKRLNTLTITDAAKFTKRFNDTQTHFYQRNNYLEIELDNKYGLKDVAIQLPKNCLNDKWPHYFTNKGSHYFINQNIKKVKVRLNCHI